MNQQEPQFTSTLEALCYHIDKFLAANPHVSEESFGWFSIKEPGLVKRLRNGRDITTRKLDAVIAYMRNPANTKKDLRNGTTKKR